MTRRENEEIVLEDPVSYEDLMWAFEKIRYWESATTEIRGGREFTPGDRDAATITIRRSTIDGGWGSIDRDR